MDTVDFIHPNDVDHLIEMKGTMIATVSFVKKDGTVRVANGLFRPSSHIVGSDRGYAQGQALRAKGLVPFYDLKKGAWISFSKDKVVGFK